MSLDEIHRLHLCVDIRVLHLQCLLSHLTIIVSSYSIKYICHRGRIHAQVVGVIGAVETISAIETQWKWFYKFGFTHIDLLHARHTRRLCHAHRLVFNRFTCKRRLF